MFDSIWFASKECCTIWVRSVKDPRRHPPRNTTAITRCNNGVLLVRVHVMSCSNPRLTLLPSARVPLTTCNSGRVVPAVSVWSRRPAGAAFDAIVLGAATFSPSFLVVSCLRNHCLGRIVFRQRSGIGLVSSTARSRTEADLGFMAISSSAALMAPRVSSLKNGIISGGITGISAGTSAFSLDS